MSSNTVVNLIEQVEIKRDPKTGNFIILLLDDSKDNLYYYNFSGERVFSSDIEGYEHVGNGKLIFDNDITDCTIGELYKLKNDKLNELKNVTFVQISDMCIAPSKLVSSDRIDIKYDDILILTDGHEYKIAFRKYFNYDTYCLYDVETKSIFWDFYKYQILPKSSYLASDLVVFSVEALCDLVDRLNNRWQLDEMCMSQIDADSNNEELVEENQMCLTLTNK